jgi:hypothetical protein
MNYSNFSAAYLQARTGTETKTTSPKLLVRSSHESKDRVPRKVPVFHSSAAKVQATAPLRSATFRQDGEFWTLSYDHKTVRLRHVKGLAYIARLLSQPGNEIHAIELACMGTSAHESDNAAMQVGEFEEAGVHVGYLGDAGELLDKQAKTAYRLRLSELRDQQTEARALGQVDRAEAAELEIDALIAELSRATGLGGRDRVAASISERARQSVKRAIKCALDRIADHHPALAEILAPHIRTGTYCSYRPDPNCRIRWSLAAVATDVTYSAVDGLPVQTEPDQVKEFDHDLPFAEVLGMILASSWGTEETTAEIGEATAALNHITPVLRGTFLQLSPQLKSSKSAALLRNIILLAVSSAPLFDARCA